METTKPGILTDGTSKSEAIFNCPRGMIVFSSIIDCVGTKGKSTTANDHLCTNAGNGLETVLGIEYGTSENLSNV